MKTLTPMILFLVMAPVASGYESSPLIIGGQHASAPISKMLGVVDFIAGHCMGERIASGWVLTAAHCLASGGHPMAVRFESESPLDVVRSFSYPGWNRKKRSIPDVALIQTEPESSERPCFRLPEVGAAPAVGTTVFEGGLGDGKHFDTMSAPVESYADLLNDPRLNPKQKEEMGKGWGSVDPATAPMILLKTSPDHRNAEGDSGGAIYAPSSREDEYILLGTITGNLVAGDGPDSTVADYGTDLSSPKVLDFIRSHVR